MIQSVQRSRPSENASAFHLAEVPLHDPSMRTIWLTDDHISQVYVLAFALHPSSYSHHKTNPNWKAV